MELCRELRRGLVWNFVVNSVEGVYLRVFCLELRGEVSEETFGDQKVGSPFVEILCFGRG